MMNIYDTKKLQEKRRVMTKKKPSKNKAFTPALLTEQVLSALNTGPLGLEWVYAT